MTRSRVPSIALLVLSAAHTVFARSYTGFDDVNFTGLGKLTSDDGIANDGGGTIISGAGTGEAPNTVGEGSDKKVDVVDPVVSAQQMQAQNSGGTPQADANETGAGTGEAKAAIGDPVGGTDQPS